MAYKKKYDIEIHFSSDKAKNDLIRNGLSSFLTYRMEFVYKVVDIDIYTDEIIVYLGGEADAKRNNELDESKRASGIHITELSEHKE